MMDPAAYQAISRLEKKLVVEQERRRENIKDSRYVETVLCHSLLTLHAVIEVLVCKGILSEEEILQASDEIDRRDGVADGEMDLTALLPESLKKAGEVSPSRFLRQLERRHQPTQEEFLQKLSEDARRADQNG